MEVSDALPGSDLISQGLRDLASGTESIESLLVLVGAPRLRRLGFDVPDDPPYIPRIGFGQNLRMKTRTRRTRATTR